MIEAFWVPGSATALLGLTVLLIFTGRLVTRSDKRDVMDERDYWRKMAMELKDQNKELLEVGELVKAVLSAIDERRSR